MRKPNRQSFRQWAAFLVIYIASLFSMLAFTGACELLMRVLR